MTPVLFNLLALAAASGAQAGTDSPPPPSDQAPIVVTGSRIPRPNQTSDSPIQSVRPEEFTITGVPNVEQTLNQLPQLVAGMTNTSNNPGGGAATLDLRGLGSVRTLILVNGRRWIADDAGSVPDVDVNTIPAALIDRVDIVTGGASAVYGSDAVTGVINFVLKSRLDGLHLEATQNVTQRGDGKVSSVDLSYGGAFFGDRARLIVSLGGLNQSPVLQNARILSSVSLTDACVIPGTRAATGASQPALTPQCDPPNVFGFVAGGSALIPGSLIPGFIRFPVAGSSALVPNLGLSFEPNGQPHRFNRDTDLYNFAPANYLQVGFRRRSANAFPSFEISRALTLYSELSYIRTTSPNQLAPVAAQPRGVTMNLDNPFLTPEAARILEINFGRDAAGNPGFLTTPEGFVLNPAFAGDADGMVRLPLILSRLEDIGPRQVLNTRVAKRGLIGGRGDLGRNWHYDVFFSSSHVKHEAAYLNSGSAMRLRQAILARRDPATGAIACIDPSNGCVPANIFGAGNLSGAAADFIRTDPVDVSIIKEQIAEGSVRGELPLLAAGPAGLVIGATWRRTSYAFVPDPSLFTGDDLGFSGGAPAAGSTHVWELFNEARIPLLAGRRFAHELSAELGLRYSRYDSVGATWTYKALADWSPVRGLRIRGGYQRAVRAPNVRELFQERFEDFTFLLDPCSARAGLVENADVAAACIRNGVPPASFDILEPGTVALALTRGNPDANAETADTFTIGAVLTPRRFPGLSATIDFYDIRIKEAIALLDGGGTWMLFGCILGAHGDPAAPVCQHFERDSDGAVAFLDQSTANIPFIRARGVDWQLNYRRDLTWGLLGDRDRAEISAAGTVYLKNGMRPNASLGELACLGTYASFACSNTLGGAVPKWKLLNRLTYGTGPASLTVRHRWFSATRDPRVYQASHFGFISDIPEEGRVLESRHYFDATATVAVNDRFRLTFGVNNLTDAKPAITGDVQSQANTDPSLYDVLGRRFFVTVAARLD